MTTDEELMAAFPRVRIDHDNAAHYRGLLEHRLLINRCADCGRWHHPPRSVCPACWSRNVVATEVSGRGRIGLVTFLHQGRRPEGAEGPHPACGIELEEQPGLRVAATVVDAPQDAIVVDRPVELTWIERDGGPVAAFRLVQS